MLRLALVGLGHLAEVPAAQLTYGHQRLLEIAMAIACVSVLKAVISIQMIGKAMPSAAAQAK